MNPHPTVHSFSPRWPWRAALLAAFALTVGGRAEPVPPGTRVVLVVDGIKEVRNLPAILAERLGYFKDEGLTVTLMEIRDEVSSEQLLMDGRADGAVAFYHHTILSQAEGKWTEAVITMGGSPGLKVLVASRLKDQIKTVADLRGRKIFTGGPNSGKTTAANWLFVHAGLKPSDFTGLALLPRDEMAAALQSGAADAIVAHEPDATFYLSRGVAALFADLTSVEETRKNLGAVFPTTALYLANAFVQSHPALTQKLVNAFYRSLRYINTHTSTEILAQLPKEIAGKQQPAAVYAHNLKEDLPMFATDGRLDAAAATTEWQVMANYAKKFTGVKIAETYTNEFVDAARLATKSAR